MTDPLHTGLSETVPVAAMRFALLYSDTPRAMNIIRAGLNFRRADHIEAKLGLLESANLFSLELFEALISGGEGYKPGVVIHVWRSLIEAEVVRPAFGHMPGAHADHHLHYGMLLRHLRDDTFVNLFNPPAALIERYASAIVAIDVVTANGAQSRGSGFVTSHSGARFLITCRHNVDPAKVTNIACSTADGATLSVEEIWLSPSEDLAIARLVSKFDAPAFSLSADVGIFDDVYTMGFPLVPRAEALVVGHRGEVNGLADLYMERTSVLLISNLVSPGSSGCPVVKKDGRCVGMTSDWLEGKYGEQIARFSAAVPASLIEQAFATRDADQPQKYDPPRHAAGPSKDYALAGCCAAYRTQIASK